MNILFITHLSAGAQMGCMSLSIYYHFFLGNKDIGWDMIGYMFVSGVLTLQTDYVRFELGAHTISWSGPSIIHWACIMCMNISLHNQAPTSFEQEKAFYLYIVSYALHLLSCHSCMCHDNAVTILFLFCGLEGNSLLFIWPQLADCRICVWNASDGSLVHSLTGHTESVSV